MQQEQVEREWFIWIVTAVMLVCISVGAVPVLKSTFFPVEKTR